MFALPFGRVSGNVFVSPHPTPDLDPEPALLALIAKAKQSILFAVYSFTLTPVATGLIVAKGRGVTVQGVGDANEWGGANSQFPQLVVSGIDARRVGSRYALMHDKVIVVDDRWVGYGSYNWTTQAERSNVELFTIVSGSKALVSVVKNQILDAYNKGT